MEEQIIQLKILLDAIIEKIDLKFERRNIDIGEFESIYKDDPDFPPELLETFIDYKNKLISYKSDKTFLVDEISQLKSILDFHLKKLDEYNLENSFDTKHATNNIPNQHIKMILKSKLLKTTDVICGEKQGKIVTGHLTEDGFLELDVYGKKKKFGSLRFAAMSIWGSDIPSQWKFWKVSDVDMPLEHFRNQII